MYNRSMTNTKKMENMIGKKQTLNNDLALYIQQHNKF